MLVVARAQAAEPSTRVSTTFTGDVWRDGVIPKAGPLGVANVHFAPGSRTHWHSHDGGQLLIILAGQGFVSDDEAAVLVGVGDVVWTPPGVRHWHGATSTRFMVHTSISMQGTNWEDAVSDLEYQLAHSHDQAAR